MNNTIKLIIEIPKYDYEEVRRLVAYNGVIATVCKAIVNDTPLDSVKAEIQKKYREVAFMDEFGSGYNYAIDEVLEILGNIGKESEE